MKVDNVSFTSRINIVPESFFNRFPYDRSHIDITTSSDIIRKVVNSDIWTDGIRTCTAGAVVNTKTKEAAGFHFYDCHKNFVKLEEYVAKMLELIPGADRALVLGAKDLKGRAYSMMIFRKLEDLLGEKIPKITTFERHKLINSESNILYSAEKDEWFVNTVFSRSFTWNGDSALTKETLLENFDRIKLADGDSLFINNEQIIL